MDENEMDEKLNAQKETNYQLTAQQQRDLEVRFTYHPPKGDQAARYQEMRGRAELMAEAIMQMTPISREQSLALTKLEECVMWANAAIARNE